MRQINVSKLPQFTPKAAKFWATIPATGKPQLLSNVFCSNCHEVIKIVDFKGTVCRGDLVLVGNCAKCGGGVTRVIESA